MENFSGGQHNQISFVLIRINAAAGLRASSNFGAKLPVHGSSAYNVLEQLRRSLFCAHETFPNVRNMMLVSTFSTNLN